MFHYFKNIFATFRFLFLAMMLANSIANAGENKSFRLTVQHSETGTKVVSVQEQKKSTAPFENLGSLPFYIKEHEASSTSKVEEWLVDESTLRRMNLPLQQNFQHAFANTETRTIVQQGPTENRINLTILGDGYTQAEKDKFFADAERITKDLFEGNTFSSYLPLFNVFAVFVPSRESGLGDGSPRDTAFELYRDPKGSKRAIMPGNPSAIESALRLAPATDYPVVIANDEFYGGLGGRYAISTRSARSGMIVLRHELGHNFGSVGEEYDNGSVYSGANSSRSADVPWRHWVKEQATPVHEAKLLSGDYVWQNLSNRPYRKNFSVQRGWENILLSLSTVGWKTPEDVEVWFDGKKLELNGSFHEDRNFYMIGPQNLAVGPNELEIREKIQDKDNVLGFAVVFAYPPSYDFTKDKIGAFATFSEFGSKSYRPTHDSCLMRDMLTDRFCSVDQENMWHRFLSKVSLIDSIEKKTTYENEIELVVKTPPLKGLKIQWLEKLNGNWTAIEGANNETLQTKPGRSNAYRAKVEFKTEEVRKYSDKFSATEEINL